MNTGEMTVRFPNGDFKHRPLRLTVTMHLWRGKIKPPVELVVANFMVIVDTLARSLTAAEIPIGILTSLIGAPFFAYIFIRLKGDS